MYKVLLVDDETINYQLFEKLVNWNEKGFEIAATAGDGLEALQKYDEISPDLIFMDIQLPLMDGLECVRCIREADKKVKIVIVSAYGDFSYAQKAIRYGVQDFLLKPVSRLMLNQIVDKMKEELLQETKGIVKTEFGTEEKKILEQILSDPAAADGRISGQKELTASEEAFCGSKAAEVEEDAKKRLQELQFCGVLFTDPEGVTVSENRYREIWTQIRDNIQTEEVAEYRLSSGYGIVFWKKEALETVIEQIKKAAEYAGVICCIYPFESQKNELAQWLLQFAQTENYGFYQRKSGIYRLEVNPFIQEEISCQDLELLAAQAVTYGSCDALLQELDRIFAEAAGKQIHPGLVKELALDILVRIKFVLKKFDQQDSFLMMRNIRMENIQNMHSISALQRFITEKIRDTYAQIQAGFGIPGKSLVFRANAFTEISYREPDFSVQKVADHIGISKNYFTTQYKEQTGCGFWEYVTELRMEKAKELLLTTEEMVGTIAGEVGYESEYHFSRKFKEYTGQSPKNFRKESR